MLKNIGFARLRRVGGSAMLGMVFILVAAAGERPADVPEAKALQRALDKEDVAAFREPAPVYRPETWFHFIGRNVAKQGITADLEAIADVRVNGEPAGRVWSSPCRLDITRMVKPGVNRLSVAVTNTWFNRLVYDAGLDEPARKTWTIKGPAKGSPLVPAGLLGPVTVRVGQTLSAVDAR